MEPIVLLRLRVRTQALLRAIAAAELTGQPGAVPPTREQLIQVRTAASNLAADLEVI